VLFSAHHLFGIPIKKLQSAGIKIGSDVPFMVSGGIKKVGGIGDEIKATNPLFTTSKTILIIKPDSSVSTAQAYQKFDEIGHVARPGTKLTNHLESAAQALNNDVKNCLIAMSGYTEYSLLCGSGSAVFGVFDNQALALAALSDMGHTGWAKITKITEKGCEIK